MSNPTIKGKNIETSNVCFAEEPKVLDNGAKYVWLGYNKKNLVVQTPVMSLPFGLNLYDKAEYPKYSVELSFSGKDSNKDLETFYQKIEELDDTIIEAGVKNDRRACPFLRFRY